MLEQFMFIQVREDNIMKTTEKIFDVSTKKETIVARDMTADELSAYQEEQVAQTAVEKLENDKVAAKAALLTKLGITEEEAKLLLS